MKNKKEMLTAVEKNYIEKVKVILSGRDDLLINALESTVDIFFEKTIKDMRRAKWYGLPKNDQENILIVDDDEMITESLSILLSKLGVIECAQNGKEALMKLATKYYGAVITDINMPVMNGIAFYNKAVDTYPSIKSRFVFYTGHADTECKSFFEKNNLRYLSKPTGIKDIKKIIANILTGC